ncbi:MAG: hypothetical protein ACKVJW_02875 [Flavobacteriales bacterium]
MIIKVIIMLGFSAIMYATKEEKVNMRDGERTSGHVHLIMIGFVICLTIKQYIDVLGLKRNTGFSFFNKWVLRGVGLLLIYQIPSFLHTKFF